ncbi:uncharacterized protein BDR25DRAFT_49675 [Lindgomyces ingoldianus]|uniref:Uncharacterized protein n=1 Tax=Lindgomyces ingoldianus TaxID=673940 RepID=A0ACB6QR35_9PLEO|nr:uncharacterized protein BDR25DRAFT_49675 [Lindgomyces ingoldianus]KAF2469454.1 hypothetical protein BDR25DRAFT_49675 [Lindgomyces ingoldianus]
MATYSEWQWSAEQRQHYCAVYDEEGTLIEYQWERGHRQPVAPSQQTHQARPQPQAPQTLQSTSPNPTVPRSVQPYLSGLAAPPAQSSAVPQAQYQTSLHPNYNQYQVSSQPQARNYTISPQLSNAAPMQPGNPVAAHNQIQSPYATSPHTSQSQYYTTSHLYGNQPRYTVSSATLPQDIQESVGGDKKQRFIQTENTDRQDERLSTQYKRVSSQDQEQFFCRGRVFKMLWTEPAGQQNFGKTRGSTHFSVVWLGEGVYSEIRRFIVVQNKGTFSQCIPVQTYRRQGATKEGLVVDDHAIVYTGHSGVPPPALLAGEYITKLPLRVIPYKNESLDKESRVNFGKPYAVEHNVKVVEIGMIAEEHIHLLVNYFTQGMSIR